MKLQERDKKHLWHPLKQHKTHPNSIAIVKAQNCVLTDEDGNTYIDAISSWYTSIFGHCNAYIINAAHAQMQTLDQIMFSDFTHEPAVKLSEALIGLLPKNQNRVFFNDNGSTAVESGIKMAIQYHFNNNDYRDTFIAFENGFHGDTFGAMAVSGLSVYNGPFKDFLMNVERIRIPTQNTIDAVLKQLKQLVKTKKIAGFIYEPLVQGAAGMKIYKTELLEKILSFCSANGILTIADEVMTGFGKTGKHFASDYVKTKPDIMCLSKALTAGLMPMAITSCTENIYKAFLSSNIYKAYFHCHTYSANPIACATALATIELLQTNNIQQNITNISRWHNQFKDSIKTHSLVKNARCIGVILALDLNITSNRYGSLRDKLLKFFMDHGVFLRPLGNTIYILPPYTITKPQLNHVYSAITKALNTLF